MNQQINIAIADDHLLFREGLMTIIQFYPNLNVLYDVSNGIALLEQMAQQLPDVVLLDLKMPQMDGIEAAERIKSLYPEVKIIVLTMHHQEDFILHMLKIGVNAYVFKNTSSQEVKKAIEAVYEKDYYFDEHISQIMLKGLRKKHISKPKLEANAQITPREGEVLELICKEHTTAEIAEKLFVSTRTIETHRKNLLEKLGVKNTAGLVIKAITYNLFQLDIS